MRKSTNITKTWKPIPIHYFRSSTRNYKHWEIEKMLAIRLTRQLSWHHWINTLPRHSNKLYRSALCIIITLGYRLYSFWLLIKNLKKSLVWFRSFLIPRTRSLLVRPRIWGQFVIIVPVTHTSIITLKVQPNCPCLDFRMMCGWRRHVDPARTRTYEQTPSFLNNFPPVRQHRDISY
jgi:hypothetical protein